MNCLRVHTRVYMEDEMKCSIAYIRSRTRIALFAAVLAMLPGLEPALANPVEGVRFPEAYRVGDGTLKIKGTGVMRYLGFIKVYAGALYAPPDMASASILADTPKRLEVEYFHSIKGEDFGPATYKGLSRSLTDEEIKKLRERIEYHNSLYVDVQPGDRYALTYVPGNGTELSRNGTTLGVIEGADFAAAIFSMWLGENPFDRRFRDELLGLDG